MSVQIESWRPVVGYEGIYEVSDLGRVRSVDRVLVDGRRWRGRVLRTTSQTRGHLAVSLSRDGQVAPALVHRLVLEAFVGPCPDGMEGCHGEGEPADNRLSNLRWDTKSANAADSIKHGSHAQTRKTHCPHNHALTAPNLLPSHAARGWRSCLSCNRERALSKAQHRPFDPDRADARYAELTRKAA